MIIFSWCVGSFLQFRNFKIVYRRYAGLYFCICVDIVDNNLYYLEAIHNFVEVLNEYFHNVCELDLVFNFYKVSFTTFEGMECTYAVSITFQQGSTLSLGLTPRNARNTVCNGSKCGLGFNMRITGLYTYYRNYQVNIRLISSIYVL